MSIGRKEGLHPRTTTAWTVMFACMPAPFVGHPFRDGRSRRLADARRNRPDLRATLVAVRWASGGAHLVSVHDRRLGFWRFHTRPTAMPAR